MIFEITVTAYDFKTKRQRKPPREVRSMTWLVPTDTEKHAVEWVEENCFDKNWDCRITSIEIFKK